VKEGAHRVTSLLRTMLLTTFFLELAGLLLLYPIFLRRADAPGAAWFDALFHSISAFCNAGFSTFSNSLESYSSSPLLVATICFLIFCGGIGFSAVYEMLRWLHNRLRRNKRIDRLSLHTMTVIQTSGLLIVFGFFAVLLGADWSGRGAGDVFLSSLFQSITPRTAGFNTIPLASIAPWCLTLIMILMFIGGAPGGTAGGVKVSTVALLFHSSRSLLKGRRHVEIRRRTIAQQTIMSAFVISGLAVAYLAVAVVALVWAEPNLPFFDLLFEAISAFGTVGLSLGVTDQLSPWGKMIIMITMYIGRVGPLTVFLALMRKRDEALYEYPAGSIIVS
ncbi:MAG: potassium transporter TrkG, partial [Candidatus Hinthialibacter sp.]